MTALNLVINEIKEVNEAKNDGSTISQDATNEELLSIFSKFDLEDDEDFLLNKFGISGYQSIRDAEQGIYAGL